MLLDLPRATLIQHVGLLLFTAVWIPLFWLPDWVGGVQYMLGLLSILFCHEMGHYIAARRRGVAVSLPYFLPGLPPFCTFGAFIKMEPGALSREALMEIGAAGPLAGVVVALPLYIAGLLMSEVIVNPPMLEPGSALIFGDSVLTWGLGYLIWGAIPAGQDLLLHPLAFAGWVGLFVTALNLVPLGQLDGGHITTAMFGNGYAKVARRLFLALVACGMTLNPVWIVLSIFLVLTGVAHPPVGEAALSGRGRAIGWLSLATFALVFVPTPLSISPLWEMAWRFWQGHI
jgi:membrane-associated protease RseP (regulator of RpoE activity)